MHSSPRRRFGTLIEALLLTGLVAALGLGGVMLYRAQQPRDISASVPQPQTAYGTETGTDIAFFDETATPSDVMSSGSDDPILSPPLPSSSYNPKPEDPLHVSACAQRETHIEVVMDYSPIIVRGTITQVPPPRWSTPDGRRPANPHARDSVGIIYRPVVLEVEEYLKGEQPQRTLVLLAAGGAIGQDSLSYCGDPIFTFQEGEHVVLFLYPPEETFGVISHDTPGGPPLLDIAEHYTVTSDKQAFNIRRQIPLQQLRDEIEASMRP